MMQVHSKGLFEARSEYGNPCVLERGSEDENRRPNGLLA
jgi:hypothetical protein